MRSLNRHWSRIDEVTPSIPSPKAGHRHVSSQEYVNRRVSIMAPLAQPSHPDQTRKPDRSARRNNAAPAKTPAVYDSLSSKPDCQRTEEKPPRRQIAPDKPAGPAKPKTNRRKNKRPNRPSPSAHLEEPTGPGKAPSNRSVLYGYPKTERKGKKPHGRSRKPEPSRRQKKRPNRPSAPSLRGKPRRTGPKPPSNRSSPYGPPQRQTQEQNHHSSTFDQEPTRPQSQANRPNQQKHPASGPFQSADEENQTPEPKPNEPEAQPRR